MSIIPTGTVTFLFTDIQGSTKLAQEHHNVWEVLRARHHAILNRAVQAHDGQVFQIVGDELCIAFHTALDAVLTAADAQRMLFMEPWEPAPIKVRMGIHTGTALAGNDSDGSLSYTGYATLARTARLMSTGHGGQVLISLATEELIRDELPADLGLRNMGDRRLKDLIRPELIFQLIIPGLPTDFPPLKTLDAYRHNLPIQLTTFIGREKECNEVRQAVLDHRLVTITGAGGIGKTRLSLHVVADLLDQFPNGIWFVDLTSLTSPELIPQTILSAIGIGDQPGVTSLQLLNDYVRDRNLLLVLDNCEHLINETARLVTNLLTCSEKLKILATSREALGVAGELNWYVPSLTLPDIHHLPPIEALSQYEAVSLFIDRATLTQPHFTVTNDNAPAIAQICHRLDGIPLAIELAAARVRVLDVEQINKRLDECFHLLTSGVRTSLPRHQTLHATIDWSYELLSDEEKVLFRRLSVFAGGWTLEAAEQICNLDEERLDVLDLLAHLVDKCLVVMDDSAGETRYHMLETTRQYASEKLAAAQEYELFRNRHCDWTLRLAETYDRESFGPNLLLWMRRLDSEFENMRAAQEWSLGRGNLDVIGMQLASFLADFWGTKGYWNESFFWLEKAEKISRTMMGTPIRAKLIFYYGWIILSSKDNWKEAQPAYEESLETFRNLGDSFRADRAFTQMQLGSALYFRNNDYKEGIALIEEAIQIYQEVGDKPRQAYAMLNLQNIKLQEGDDKTALAIAQEALDLFRACDNGYGIASSLAGIGSIFISREEYREARKYFEESLGEFEKFGTKLPIAETKEGLGDIYRALHEYDQAEVFYKECLAMRQEVGQPPISFVPENMSLGYTALYRGNERQAVQYFKEALRLNRKFGGRQGQLAGCLHGFAAVTAARGNAEDAALLYGAAQSLDNTSLNDRSQRNIGWSSVDRRELEQSQALCCAKLGDSAYEAALKRGRGMTLDEAIALALERTDFD